jgi:hypothetical protein
VMARKATGKRAKAHAQHYPRSAEKLDKARGLLEGPSLAANAIDSLKMTADLTDTSALILALAEQTRRVNDGDLNRAESERDHAN